MSATGTYDVDETVVVRYRNRDGAQGIDVVVPLVTADGTALLVDRGWLETDPSGADRGDVPAPPAGEVAVTGYVRDNGSGDSTEVSDLSTRAINSEEIGAAIGRPVYGGFVELRSEDPEPDTALTPAELPELDNGPHFFYGLQWWFFGVLAIFGFGYLLYDEWRNGPRGERLTRHAAAEVEGPAAGRGGQGADRAREGRAGGSRLDLHHHGLGLGEELPAEGAALAAHPGVTDTTERRPQVADEEAVDPDRARPSARRRRGARGTGSR